MVIAMIPSLCGRGVRFCSYAARLQYISGSDIVIVHMKQDRNLNALSYDFINQFDDVLSRLSKDVRCKVIILKSNLNKVFCAGADLKERFAMTNDDVTDFTKNQRRIMSTIEQLHCPVIAAIDGVALGGGLELALACDIRIAADNAVMGLVETRRFGIIPGAGGSQRLYRTIGGARAKEMIYTGARFSAAQAAVYEQCSFQPVGLCFNPYNQFGQLIDPDTDERPLGKPLKRVIHFCDGTLEEYSDDDEQGTTTSRTTLSDQISLVDSKSLTWAPYLWHVAGHSGNTTLRACDWMGERLAWFFGITTPKYQSAIDEHEDIKSGRDAEPAEERIVYHSNPDTKVYSTATTTTDHTTRI